jgi:hypothetical protein
MAFRRLRVSSYLRRLDGASRLGYHLNTACKSGGSCWDAGSTFVQHTPTWDVKVDG